MHVHLPTVSFLDSAIKPFREPAEKFFRRKVPITRMDDVAEHYEKLDIVGVLLAWDAETATGLPPLTNDEIAGIVAEFPERFIGFGSVDPWKGKRAVAEIERAVSKAPSSIPASRRSTPTTHASRSSSRKWPSSECPLCSTPEPTGSARGPRGEWG
jgi:hypothetical protein